jgi:nucleoside 2-deoxyribosyltransferase
MPGKVYLAGPITGMTYEGCTSWREYAIKELKKYDILGISPMRCKEYLNDGSREFLRLKPDERPLTSDKGIVTRDRWDVTQNCDIILANLLEAKQVSIGTVFEYAWADMARKPIITVIESKGNPHEHPMVRETTGFRVETLEKGLYLARAILSQ